MKSQRDATVLLVCVCVRMSVCVCVCVLHSHVNVCTCVCVRVLPGPSRVTFTVWRGLRLHAEYVAFLAMRRKKMSWRVFVLTGLTARNELKTENI